jgi:hypothetical protein
MIDSWDVVSTVVWNINTVEEYYFIKLNELPFDKNFVNCEMLFDKDGDGNDDE